MLGLGLTHYIPYFVYFGALLAILIGPFKPKISLYFLIALLPLRTVLDAMQDFPMGKDVNDLLFLSIILGWFLNIRDEQGKILTKTFLNKYVMLLLVFSFLSFIFGAFYWGLGNPFDLGNARFVDWKNFAMLPILYLMSVNLFKTKKEIVKIVLIMIVILFLADIHFYMNVEGKDLSIYREDLRQGGIFTNLGVNELAAFHAHFIFLPLGLMFYEKRWPLRTFYIGSVIFTFYPILFLFSRGAYVATFLGLLYIGIKKSKVLVICLLVLFFLWMTVLPTGVVERIKMTETESGLDSSSGKRLEYWGVGVKQFLKSPLIGVGFDTSKYFLGSDLHNAYIEILAEQGIIGLWIFLALLILTFRHGTWLYKNSNDDFIKGLGLATGGIITAVAATNLFGDRWTYMELSAFLFVLMAVVVNCKKIVLSQVARE